MPVKVYYINVKIISKKTLSSYYSDLSEYRKLKVKELKNEEDKRLSIMAEVLLKYAFKKEGITLPLKISTNECGKPYIEGIYFNISHSFDYVAVAVSNEEVGVDIEKITDRNFGIAKRFFSKKEYEDINSVKDEKDRKKLFFRYWTIKESFLKAIGYGLNKPLNAFTVNLKKKITVTQDIVNENFYFCEYKRIKNYALSVCSLETQVEFFRVQKREI